MVKSQTKMVGAVFWHWEIEFVSDLNIIRVWWITMKPFIMGFTKFENEQCSTLAFGVVDVGLCEQTTFISSILPSSSSFYAP